MRRCLLFLSLLLIASSVLSFEHSMPNLQVPTNLEQGGLALEFKHRFYGKINEDPFGTLFGMRGGANVGLGLRYLIWKKLEVKAHYNTYQRESTIGFSYAFYITQLYLRTQADIQFFTYRKTGIDERRNNFFYMGSVQTEPIANHIIPAFNIGYDGYNKKLGLGFGLNTSFDISFNFIRNINFSFEYYPVLSRDEEIHGDVNTFVFASEIQTFRHHFTFTFSNTSQIGMRRLMLGTDSNNIYFGFNVSSLILY